MVSQETEIAILQTNMANVEKKVDEGFAALKADNAETKQIILDFIKKSEDKYAGKWVETVFRMVGYMFLTAIVGGIIYIIFKNPVVINQIWNTN